MPISIPTEHKQIIEKTLSTLEQDSCLVDEQFKEWNRNYLSIQWPRYLSDLDIIGKWYSSGSILEVGGLPYHMSLLLKNLGFQATCIDLDPKRAANFIQRHELEVVGCDIEGERLPFEDNSFDFIIFNEVFEHLRFNPINCLEELNRVLKDNGLLMLSTPNAHCLKNRLAILRGKSYDDPYAEYKKLKDIGHMGHVREYSTGQVLRFLKNTGFNPVDIQYRSYQKSSGFIDRILLNPIMAIRPKFRPFQIIISRKKG